MVCDLCRQNPAIVFIEQESSAGKRRICLCKNCAGIYNIQDGVSVQNNKEIIKLFDKIFNLKDDQNPESKKLCPVCGRSLLMIRRTGIAGCSECYATFPNEIRSMLKEFNIDQIYAGSLPKRLQGFRNTLTDRMDIQMKLDEAIKNEDYEKAAVYRDFLRALEKGSVSDGEDKTSFSTGIIGDKNDTE